MAELIAQRLLSALAAIRSNCDESLPSQNALDLLSSTPAESEISFRQTANLKQWNDDIEKDLLSAATLSKFRVEEPSASTPPMKECVIQLHLLLLRAVDPSTNEDGWTTDEAAAEASRQVADKTSQLSRRCEHEEYCKLLVELLRAAGLVMRWYGLLQSTASTTLNNSLARLKCDGMLLICLKLMDMDISTIGYPDVPRFASIYLFRATYGNDSLTISARTSLVESLDGCHILMKEVMKGGQPVCRILSLVRNVHHLIASYPSSISKLNKAVEELTKDVFPCSDGKHDLLEVLVVTLSWAYRSEPPFPGDISDRRSELALEMLRALFALDAGISSISEHSNDTMTQIGIILCEFLQLPSADFRVYECKLAIVALLLNSPKEYGEYFAMNGGIKPLVDIMAYQLSVVIIERTSSGAEDAAAVVPILLTLQRLCQANSSVLRMVKRDVFPPDVEDEIKAQADIEIDSNITEGPAKSDNMAPLDAPKGTLRWKLIRLMTWTESNVKRSASELLWTLCNEDSTEFVLRTGFGNAIHLLGMKGCVTLPKGIDI